MFQPPKFILSCFNPWQGEGCTLSSFALWLPVGFVQREVQAGDQRVGGGSCRDNSPLLPPSWVLQQLRGAPLLREPLL